MSQIIPIVPYESLHHLSLVSSCRHIWLHRVYPENPIKSHYQSLLYPVAEYPEKPMDRSQVTLSIFITYNYIVPREAQSPVTRQSIFITYSCIEYRRTPINQSHVTVNLYLFSWVELCYSHRTCTLAESIRCL